MPFVQDPAAKAEGSPARNSSATVGGLWALYPESRRSKSLPQPLQAPLWRRTKRAIQTRRTSAELRRLQILTRAGSIPRRTLAPDEGADHRMYLQHSGRPPQSWPPYRVPQTPSRTRAGRSFRKDRALYYPDKRSSEQRQARAWVRSYRPDNRPESVFRRESKKFPWSGNLRRLN